MTRCGGVLPLVQSAALLVVIWLTLLSELPVKATVSPTTSKPVVLVPSVEIDNSLYGTIDFVDPYTPNNPQHPGYVSCSTTQSRFLPGGWVVAPVTADALFAATNYYWGSPAVILANGNSYATNSSSSTPISTGQLIGNKTSGYRPAGCVQRILITSPSTSIPVAINFTAIPATTAPKGTTTPTTKTPAPAPKAYTTSVPYTLEPTTPNPAYFNNTLPTAVVNFTYPPPITSAPYFTTFPPASQTPTTRAPTPQPTGTPAPTPQPTGTPAPTPQPTGTPAPTPQPTGTPAPTPQPTGTPAPTPQPTATQAPTPQPTTPTTPRATTGAPTTVPPFSFPPDQVVVIGGIQYTTLDETGPNGENYQICNETVFRPLPTGWSLADRTNGSMQAIAAGTWGTYRMILGDGTAWDVNTLNSVSAPDDTNQLITDGVGYTSRYCDYRVLISAPVGPSPAPTPLPTPAPTPAPTPISGTVAPTPAPFEFPPNQVVIINGVQYTTLDETGPNGENFQACNNTGFRPLPVGWSLAARTTGAMQAIAAGTWGTYRMVLGDGTAWDVNTLNSVSSPDDTNQLITDGVGYTARFCDYRVLISAPGPTPAPTPAVTLAPTPAPTPATVVFPPDQVVVINGTQYTTLDGTGPNGANAQPCNSTFFRTLPTGWSLADRTPGAMQAIAAGTWATWRIILSDGSAWDANNLYSVTDTPGAEGQLNDDGQGGYTSYNCDYRILITAPAPPATTFPDPEPTSPYEPLTVPPGRTVILNGLQYSTLDFAGPDGTGGSTCDNNAYRKVPDGWQIASRTNDSVQVISEHSWGTYRVVLADGTGFDAGVANNPSAPDVTNWLKTDGNGGYTVAFCDYRILISAPAPYVAPPPTNYTLGLKVLVVSQYHNLAQDYRLSTIVTALRSFGIPFDIYTAYDNNTNACNTQPPVLETSYTHGKYYAIAMTSFSMFVSSTNCAPISLIRAYQEKFHVRLFSAFSTAFACCSSAMTEVASPPASAYLKLDPDLPLEIGVGLKRDTAVPIKQSEASFTRVSITDSSAVPVLRYVSDPAATPTGSDYVASAFFTSSYGEEYHLFYDNSEFLLNSAVFGDLWVNWLVKGVYFGMRRSFLIPHADDLVISTALWDPAQKKQGTITYRATGQDLNLLAAFQASYVNRFGPGEMKVLFAVNSVGVYTAPGGPLRTNDTLKDAVQANFDNFYYVSHTYTHMDLTCVDVTCPLYYAKSFEAFRPEWERGKATNYSQTFGELLTNNDTIAGILFAGYSNQDFNTVYSLTTMVNPRISGLFNPNSVKAMTDFGIQVIVGDNTRNELYPYPEFLNDGFDWPPAAYQSRADPRYLSINFYHGRYLTQAVNGYNDPTKFYRQIFMIPRFASEVYYDCSTLEEDISEYNFIRGTNKTWEELYTGEANRVVFNLLWHRWDPHMFHQANIRSIIVNGTTNSLVQLWIEYVMTEFRKYSVLPVSSANMEVLGSLYIERMERDVDCGFDNVLNVVEGQVESITFNSSYQSPNGCYVRLSGVPLSSVSSPPVDAAEETYGADTTIKFQMPGSRRSSLPAGYSAPPPYQSSVNVRINGIQWN